MSLPHHCVRSGGPGRAGSGARFGVLDPTSACVSNWIRPAPSQCLSVDNSGRARVGHARPVKNLYLAGAWSRPGHGYGAVIPSGLECFAEVMKGW